MDGASDVLNYARSLFAPWWEKRWFRLLNMLVIIGLVLRLTTLLMSLAGLFWSTGNSLQPTVSWLSVSRERQLQPGELPEVGCLYSYRRPAETAKTPMARLKQYLGWRYATKWCWSVDEQSQTWTTGTDDGDMPISAIDRKVVAIWDWQWLLDKKAGGQLSWARLHAGPHDYAVSGRLLYFIKGGQIFSRERDGTIGVVSLEDRSAPLALVGAVARKQKKVRNIDVVDIRPRVYVYPVFKGEFVLLEHKSAPTRVLFCGEERMEGVGLGVTKVPFWTNELRLEVLESASEEKEGIVQGAIF